jgi:hypothetical protein
MSPLLRARDRVLMSLDPSGWPGVAAMRDPRDRSRCPEHRSRARRSRQPRCSGADPPASPLFPLRIWDRQPETDREPASRSTEPFTEPLDRRGMGEIVVHESSVGKQRACDEILLWLEPGRAKDTGDLDRRVHLRCPSHYGRDHWRNVAPPLWIISASAMNGTWPARGRCPSTSDRITDVDPW